MTYTTTAFFDLAAEGYYLQDLNELWAIGWLTDEMTYEEYWNIEMYLLTGKGF